MLIDWTTVIAQIVNFLILLILLKYLLYNRIIKAMDKREERIQSRLEDAERKRQEAEQEMITFENKNRELDQDREQLLDEARKEAEAYKNQLIQHAREEVESLQKRWYRSIEQEKESFVGELRRLAAKQVYDICRRALAELSNTEIENQTVGVFLDRFQNMEKGQKGELLSVNGQVLIKSSHEVSKNQRQQIEQILNEMIKDLPEIIYETDPAIIMGIEIKRRDKKIAWSLESYLSNLERMTFSAFEKEIKKHKQNETDIQKEEKSNNRSDSEQISQEPDSKESERL
jgi:F-type H+-transporting ATPase subunit b